MPLTKKWDIRSLTLESGANYQAVKLSHLQRLIQIMVGSITVPIVDRCCTNLDLIKKVVDTLPSN